ncbi:hypothetical protein [Cupriavidus sp. USMAA2-4]|uniref:hypothetical protein n=1 Tax=Cupriavidus sp. USMAA2-4 TaxID=876364 RepID=UPI0012F4D7F3|nr:hypothetical protein [Cupriavidus sp. USMAA2-4]
MLTAQLIDTVSTRISAAESPEEAARIFAQLATAAIGQAVANALADAIGKVSSARPAQANSPILGWERCVKGASIQMDWCSPGMGPTSTLLPGLFTAALPVAGAVHPAGVDIGITIGIHGSF